MKKSFGLLLGCIVVLAAFLRLYSINTVPVSLYWDEAAITYNAYSIAMTGKDEFGSSLPLLFQSFNDYKMPGNIYLTAFMVNVFGLNEFSARAASAFLGIATVLVTFFLVKTLLSQSRMAEKIALLTSFMLAISPWHVQFSRTGFEANSGVFFIVLGSWLFLRSISFKHSLSFIVASISFALSFYFYRSIFLFVPFLMVILFSLYGKKVVSVFPKKILIVSGILFIIIFVPILRAAASPEGLTRAKQVAILTNSSEKVYEAAKKQLENPGIIGKFLYNRRVVYVQEFMADYISHFNPSYLFLHGDDNGRHGPRGMGLLYLWEVPFIIVGLYVLTTLDKKISLLIIGWILIGPIAAATSLPSPHALRSLNILPMPMLLTALGANFVFGFFKKRWKILAGSILTCICMYSTAMYLHLYYYKTAQSTSAQWADGYKQLTEYIFAHEEGYEKVVITGYNWQPYIYFLLYKHYDPVLFQRYGSKQSFDKYVFGGTSWDMNGKELHDTDLRKFAGSERVLVALSPEEFEAQKENIHTLTEIKNHNNEIVYIVGEL